ncbi:MAG: DEAD/DEAH box helicase, partial [Rikenellaceae bacterium]
MGFQAIGVRPDIIDSLNKIGVVNPTPIQLCVVPRAVEGESVVARSQTGSGKTLSYLVPMIQRFMSGQRGLILAPTRELVQQIAEVLKSISSLSVAVIYGGVEYAPQCESLALLPDIIISTVGRLKDLMAQGVAAIDKVDYFVLDEVDQMLDLGFRDDILQLSALRSEVCQTLCFSATLPSQVNDVVENLLDKQYFKAEVKDESLAVERIE